MIICMNVQMCMCAYKGNRKKIQLHQEICIARCALVKKNKMVWFCNAKTQFMADITEKTMPDLFLM